MEISPDAVCINKVYSAFSSIMVSWHMKHLAKTLSLFSLSEPQCIIVFSFYIHRGIVDVFW